MKRLKTLREEKKLSQQALAEKFNLSQQSIYKYENGLAEPSIRTLKDFATFFNTSIDYLVELVDDPTPSYIINYDNFSFPEIEHIKTYHALSASHRRQVEYFCKILSEETHNN